MSNRASLLNCLYNVHLASGMERLTGRETIARFGWDDFHSDYVMHSEWCGMDHGTEAEEARAALAALIPSDPFMVEGDQSEPPF